MGPMPRPSDCATGKVTGFRAELDYLRTHPETVYTLGEACKRVAALYLETGSIKATAKGLGVGKRTLERAIRDVPELATEIETARVRMGRP